MAHRDDASTYADLLARLGGDGTNELFRHLLEEAVQDLIDAELTSQVGASRHERSEARSNYRNGGRSRLLSTPARAVELRFPMVRAGSFFPSLLEPRRRVDKALWAVIITAYNTGTSTRKVDDLVKALGGDSGVSSLRETRIGSSGDLGRTGQLPVDPDPNAQSNAAMLPSMTASGSNGLAPQSSISRTCSGEAMERTMYL